MLSQTALLVIDVQQGFNDTFYGHRNNPQAEKNIALLVAAWRQNQRPLYFVQHASTSLESPLHPSKPGFDFKPESQPMENEIIITKHVNSAFIGTALDTILISAGIKDLIAVGLTTDHCVSTTTRMGENLGFNMTVVADATATFDRVDHLGNHFQADQVHAIHLASLSVEFATITDTYSLLEKN